MRNEAIERVHRALEDIRAGRMVVLVDDEHRENEGDLCMAAEKVTPETINFMARYGRGLICLTMTPERVAQLELPMMVEENRTSRGTAFTVSIEAREGVTTGISAADRARTVQAAVAPDAKPGDLVSPGHIFPLKGVPGGVLQRTGHTEGSIDLAQLAGCSPAGVICEIMNDDGSMARYPQLLEFAERHGLRLLSIADLIQYRLQTERLVQRLHTGQLVLPPGKRRWQAHVYSAIDERHQFLALTLGEIDGSPTLVRVHTGSVLGDVFGARAGVRVVAAEAIWRIEQEGRGVVLFIPPRVDLLTDLKFHLGEATAATPDATEQVLREVGLGAQILLDLGVRKMRLLTNRPRRVAAAMGYDLEIVEQVLVRDLTGESIRPGASTH